MWKRLFCVNLWKKDMKAIRYVCLAVACFLLLGCSKSHKEADAAGKFVYEGSTRTAPIVAEPVALPNPDYKTGPDGTNAFVIIGADLSSDIVKNGNFITEMDNQTGDYYILDLDGIVLPHVKAIQTVHRRVAQALAPNVGVYIINDHPATKAEFDSIPAPMFEAVRIVGDTLKLKTRETIDSRNDTYWKLYDNELNIHSVMPLSLGNYRF